MQQFRLVNLNQVQLFVNGEWLAAQSGKTFKLINPSTLEVLAEVPYGGKSEAELAIKAAEKAFPEWAAMTAYERAEYILRLRDLMLEHEHELAQIMSMEMGKAYTEACGEVKYAAGFLTWYAEEGKRIYGETIPASVREKRLFVIRQPVGVVA
nr:succinate-semialdehyde dehydrogenase (NADP(+)) [Bacillota bacterium]